MKRAGFVDCPANEKHSLYSFQVHYTGDGVKVSSTVSTRNVPLRPSESKFDLERLSLKDQN